MFRPFPEVGLSVMVKKLEADQVFELNLEPEDAPPRLPALAIEPLATLVPKVVAAEGLAVIPLQVVGHDARTGGLTTRVLTTFVAAL